MINNLHKGNSLIHSSALCLPCVLQCPVYSTVNKTNCDDAVHQEDKEHDYSSIAEIKGLVPAFSSSDLYATVRDIYTQPGETSLDGNIVFDATDPGYETIHIRKTTSSDDDLRAELGAEGSDAAKAEPDYESFGELGLDRETSRLWVVHHHLWRLRRRFLSHVMHMLWTCL